MLYLITFAQEPKQFPLVYFMTAIILNFTVHCFSSPKLINFHLLLFIVKINATVMIVTISIAAIISTTAIVTFLY